MTVIYVVLGAGWVVPIVLVVRDRIAQRTPAKKAGL